MTSDYLSQEQLSSRNFQLRIPGQYKDAIAGLANRQGIGTPVFPSPAKKLQGFFFLDKPFRREGLLYEINLVYDDIETLKIGEREALLCRMKIAKGSRQYLCPFDFNKLEKGLGQHLLSLARNPPIPYLDVWYDETWGYWKANVREKEVERWLE